MCWNSRQLHELWDSSGAVEACAAKPAFVGFFLQQPLSVGDSLVTGVELEGPIWAWSGGCRGDRAWANAVVKVQTFSAFWYDVDCVLYADVCPRGQVVGHRQNCTAVT